MLHKKLSPTDRYVLKLTKRAKEVVNAIFAVCKVAIENRDVNPFFFFGERKGVNNRSLRIASKRVIATGLIGPKFDVFLGYFLAGTALEMFFMFLRVASRQNGSSYCRIRIVIKWKTSS